MGSYYDYYSSYFPSYHRWAEQDATGEESQKRKKHVREGHSPWKIFSVVFLIIILILSITAAVVIPIVFLRQSNSNGGGGGQGGSGSTTPSVPLTGTNVVFITDVKIADSMGWPWDSQLLDSTTPLYQTRAGQVCQSISSIFKTFPIIEGSFISCQINSFRFGSIYANLDLTINCQDTSNQGLVNVSRQIQSTIIEAMETSWFPASVDFNSTSLNVNAVPLTASNPCQAMPCQQICLPGDSSSSSSSAYVCSCFEGYQLVNGKMCIDFNECNSSSNTCAPPSGMCVNLPGTYSCTCNKGYYHPDNSKACVVIPYCGTPAMTCDLYTTMCQNVIGNYTCTCLDGYSNLQANNSCLDINECQSNNGWCDIYTTNCTNTVGSYECDCLPHFERIPGVWSACQNIDECFTGEAECDDNSTVCVDTFGNYTCDCKWGFQPNPNSVLNCTDIDECASGTNNCDFLSTTCNNTIGGFDCLCLPAFMKNASRRFCTYQGMCPAQLDKCDHNTTMCMDTGIVGNYTCNCIPGYTPVDQFSCKDIDECAIGTSSCDDSTQYCMNTPGNFTCSCIYGNTSGVCNVAEYGVQVYLAMNESVAANSPVSFSVGLPAGWPDLTATTQTVPVNGTYLISGCAGIDMSTVFPVMDMSTLGQIEIMGPSTAAVAGNSMTSCQTYLAAMTVGTTISVTNAGSSTITLLENVNSLMAVNLATIFPNGYGMFSSTSTTSQVTLNAGTTPITFASEEFWSTFPSSPSTSPSSFNDGLYVITFSVNGGSLPVFSLQLMISSSPQAYLYVGNSVSDLQTVSRSVMLSLTASDTITLTANSATGGNIQLVTLSIFQYAPLPMVPNVAWSAVGCTLSSPPPSGPYTPNLACSNIGVSSPNITISPATIFTAPVAGVYWLEFTLTIQLTATTPASVIAVPIVANATSTLWDAVVPGFTFSLTSASTTGTQTLSRSSLVELDVGDKLGLNIISSASTAIVAAQLHDSEFSGFLLYPS